MKKLLIATVLSLVAFSANAGVDSPLEKKRVVFTWHPTSVAIGAIAGAATFGGLGAVIVGGVVAEMLVRAYKDSHAEQAVEEVATNEEQNGGS